MTSTTIEQTPAAPAQQADGLAFTPPNRALTTFGLALASFMRTQLATVQGAVMPYPYGGKFRSVMVDIDSRALQAKRCCLLR